MLDYDELLNIADTIKNNYPKDAKDLSDALDLVSLALDGIYDNVSKEINLLFSKREIDKAKEMLDFPQHLLTIQEKLNEYTAILIDEEEIQQEVYEITVEEENEKRVLPNYIEYTIDKTIPHNLHEDYTHTKACGFSLQNKYYEARNMRDVLIQTCAILADKDIIKMESFVDDPTMKGKKVSYFGKKYVVEDFINKNEQIPGTDLYVWVNLSCNNIRNILRKILKKYGIGLDNFKIYLRADYSELHKDNEAKILEYQIPQGEEKIGKHVKKSMRKLSDLNYKFSQNQIIAMQSAQWSKDTIGVYGPLIKKYSSNIDWASQVVVNSYSRYWQDLFVFNGEKYFVTSQWYERHRKAFSEWFNSLDLAENK